MVEKDREMIERGNEEDRKINKRGGERNGRNEYLGVNGLIS